jgi:hypothetical protein
MEASIEAYLDQKAIKYEKNIGMCIFYILENDIVENIDNVVKNGIIIEDNNKIAKFLNENNIKYKQVLDIFENTLYIDYQINIDNFKFIVDINIFTYTNYLPKILFYSEYLKFIKNNTIFKLEEYIINEPSTCKDFKINISYNYKYIIVKDHKLRKFMFASITEFIDWFTVNMPEYLRNDDIKIALKD